METAILIILLLLSGISLFLIWIIFKVIKQNLYYKVIRKHDSPFLLSVENKNNTKQKAVLFGTNQYLLTPNFGSDIPVEVKPLQSNVSYLELLQQSAHCPFTTRTIKFNGKIQDLEDLILTFTSRDANGNLYQSPKIVRNYIDKNKIDFNDTESEQSFDIEHSFNIDGNSQIYFELNPNSSIKIAIFYNTIGYSIMTLFGYIKDLIKGNLPKEQKSKIISPSIMPPSIKTN